MPAAPRLVTECRRMPPNEQAVGWAWWGGWVGHRGQPNNLFACDKRWRPDPTQDSTPPPGPRHRATAPPRLSSEDTERRQTAAAATPCAPCAPQCAHCGCRPALGSRALAVAPLGPGAAASGVFLQATGLEYETRPGRATLKESLPRGRTAAWMPRRPRACPHCPAPPRTATLPACTRRPAASGCIENLIINLFAWRRSLGTFTAARIATAAPLL